MITPLTSEKAIRGRDARIKAPNRNVGATRASHYSDEWYTPAFIPAALGEFDLDPCAGPLTNHARQAIRFPERCGLATPWVGRVWLNPPYSNIHEWLAKMIAHRNGVALVNARTDTQWFQNSAATATALFWIKGRVKFERPDRAATNMPVGSVLFAWGEENAQSLLTATLPGLFTRVGK